jgi:F-type H+-transporting ATPase subunit b
MQILLALRESAEQEIATEQDRVIVQLRQQSCRKKPFKKRSILFWSWFEESYQIELIDRSIALLSSD